MERDAVIVSYGRTPIGSLCGAFTGISASQLGAYSIRACIDKLEGRFDMSELDSVVLGHVLTANSGQSSARQAAILAGLPASIPSFSVDKVCASGMKAAMIASASISSGAESIIIAGGMESMTSAPHYLPGMRVGKKLGHDHVVDGLLKDGLWDVYNDKHMGTCTETVNEAYSVSRSDLDAYAALTFRRATEATQEGVFAEEIVPVIVNKGGKEISMSVDEHLERVKVDKFSSLKPSFKSDGVLTPANSSPISDGAAAMVLMSRKAAFDRGISPIVRVVAWADAAREPAEFTIAPALAITKVLKQAGLSIADIGVWELNEAFGTVVLANMKILGDELHLEDVNIFGGALSLGHPLGCSGARIICTLLTAMKFRKAKYGCAAICNGGGGASAMIFQLE